MATVATQRTAALPRPSFTPIIQDAVVAKKASGIEFKPSKHLGYKDPEKIWTMEEIGYSKDRGVSPIAVSQPFQLFTEEAVHEMRREIFKPEVMENCKYSSNIAACQLRGYAPKSVNLL